MNDAHARPRLFVLTPQLLAAAACTFSGMAAVAFETLWYRQASLEFGNSIWASSLVLSGFMAGLACGCAAAERILPRIVSPLKLFVGLELIVAISGIGLVYALPKLPPLLPKLSAALELHPGTLQIARLIAAFLLTLVPATAMGMTLPVLVRALHAADHRAGRVLGVLYGTNTTGAVFGTLLPQLSWISSYGVRGSAFAAAGCNAAAAVLAVACIAFARGSSLSEPLPASKPTPLLAAGSGRWLLASALIGFAMMGLEVVWLRLLVLFVSDTELAFAWVMAGVLSGLAIGGWTAAALGRSDTRSAQFAPWLAIATAALAMLSYRAELWWIAHFFRFDQSPLVVALPLTLPVAIASGWLFTVLGAGLCETIGEASAAIGRIALANTFGGVAGSLFAGFWLLPRVGMERTFFGLCMALIASASLWIFERSASRSLRASLAVGSVALLISFPFNALQPLFVRSSVGRWMRPGDDLISVREGVIATFSHVVHRVGGQPLFDQLTTNAYSMSVNDFAARRYMKQFAILPRAVHPHIERALLIGYGIGSTAAALLDDDTLRRLDVVDVAEEVLDLSREMHTQPGPSPLDDARVRVHIEDGRHYLAGHDTRYDLITGEPPPPIIAGVVDLYTREFFSLLRSRLNENGLASYWLPLMNLPEPSVRAIIAGFCAAFPDCSLWHGSARNFMLLGTRDAPGHTAVSSEQFARQWQRPDTEAELRAIGFEYPEQLGAAFIGDATYLMALTRGSPQLTDDRPKRVNMPAPITDRDALIWRWRDTTAARERFEHSPLIASLWPSDMLAKSLRQFENQRLLNDLLFPEITPVRQTSVLHQVLQGTQLQLPVLLLMKSDPDVQRVLDSARPGELTGQAWDLHRAAGLLARRDFQGALRLLEDLPKAMLPFEDLTDYLAFVTARMQQDSTFPAR